MKRSIAITATAAVLFVAVVSFAGCTPNGADAAANQEKQAASVVEAEWTQESDCASCHVNEAESGTSPDCLYSMHVEEGGTCSGCHINDDGKLATAHERYQSADPPTKLRKTDVSSEACLESCHVQEELAAKTAGSTALTDSNGTVVNPHDMPATEGHGEHSCASCHKMHEPSTAVEEAQSFCLSCHHSDVYECNTCHTV